MTVEYIKCKEGVVGIHGPGGLLWDIPHPMNSAGKVYRITHDWSKVPDFYRDKYMGLGRLIVEQKGVALYGPFWMTLEHLVRYNIEDGGGFRDYSKFTESDWGAFAEWLKYQPGDAGEPLKLVTRRTYFTSWKLALEVAFRLGKYGVTEDDVESIQTVMQRRFRDSNLLAARRAADRAFTAEERQNLREICRKEWLAWKDWYAQYGQSPLAPVPPDLVTVVAVWLAWEEAVRPEELNVMTVDDIDLETCSLFLHAPNKREGYIEFDKRITRALLKALIEWGAAAREQLHTRHLFVEPAPKPRALRSLHLKKRLRGLLKTYYKEHPIEREDVLLADGRKTLGSLLAAETQDEELVRLTLRHASTDTMKVYYVRQGKVTLSRNVRTALKEYATRLSMAYNRAVIDPLSETPPDIAEVLRRNPNFETPYGACSDDVEKKGPCQLGIHCGDCSRLIPMASKLNNFVVERDLYLKLADDALERGGGDTNDRTYQNRLAHAGMLDGHIMNIQRRLEEANESGNR